MKKITPKPIHKRKQSHELRDQLLEYIYKGDFKSGDKLPSEHKLMELFQVGRPTVREALQAIENMGMITIKHGGGTTVNKPSAATIFEQIEHQTRYLLSFSKKNVQHLVEARQLFEVGVVQIATQKATPDDIKKLKQIINKMKTCKTDHDQFVKADISFHLKLADISGNPIFFHASKAFFNWIDEHRKDVVIAKGLESLTIKEHEEVLANIIEKNPEGAGRTIQNHILRTNKIYAEIEKE